MTIQRLAILLALFIATVAQAQTNSPFKIEPIASFDEPWALAQLPDGRLRVTEKKGNLFMITGQDALDHV